MTLEQSIEAFRDRVVGTTIRGQHVAGVELTIDSNTDSGQLRYILCVLFSDTILPQDMDPSEKMLRRVFDERPSHARCVVQDIDDLKARLAGEKACDWLLPDEAYVEEKL